MQQTGAGGGAAMASPQQMVSTFASWLQQSPTLAACMQSSYPNLQPVLQQAQGGQAGGAAQPTTGGMTGTTGGTTP